MRLRTFGGLSIDPGSGGEDSPALAPRHLALLSVVAAAEPRGITRDRIVGILWAETAEEQARHTLSQNLYFLRRETGKDLVAGSTQLRLDSSITSDVGDFRLALEAGDLARAAAIYAGPFLDGFYLPGAPEFERWVEDERSKLKGAATTAVEALSDRAVSAGAINESIAWWRRLRELDPFSARYAAGLIRALISADDRVAALRFAQSYEQELRRELDADLDPSVDAFPLVAPNSEPAVRVLQFDPAFFRARRSRVEARSIHVRLSASLTCETPAIHRAVYKALHQLDWAAIAQLLEPTH